MLTKTLMVMLSAGIIGISSTHAAEDVIKIFIPGQIEVIDDSEEVDKPHPAWKNLPEDLSKITIPDDAVESRLTFRPAGSISRKCEYKVDGENVGERLFYESGQVAEEKVFRNGRLYGIWRQFYENGKLFSERPYRGGKPDGSFRFWDEQGTLLGESLLEQGNGVLREYENFNLGSYNAEIPFVNGRINGKKTTWASYDGKDEGIGQEQILYKNGRKNGWYLVYRANGTLSSSAYYHNNKFHSLIRIMNPDGKLKKGYPKYFVSGREVTKEKYLIASKNDSVLQITLENDRPQKEI